MKAIYLPLTILLFFATACGLIEYQHKPPVFSEPEGPFAKVDKKYLQANIGESVSLDGAASFDLAGHNLDFTWELKKQPDGSQARLSGVNTPAVSLLIDKAGIYKVHLQVSNGNSQSEAFITTISTEADALPEVGFIAIGDFGTGKAKQYAVAKGIEATCETVKCDFVVGLGDNIYKAGVWQVFDKQFDKKFEKPYSDINLPFYMVMGNHDNSGFFAGDGSWNYRGELQIAYSREQTRDLDKANSRKNAGRQLNKWQMPSRYFEVPAPVEDVESQPLVSLLAIDSTVMTSFKDPMKSFDMEKRVKQQSRWIRSTLLNTTSQWQIAFAHHPYLSNGRHGNAGSYDFENKCFFVFTCELTDKYVLKRAQGEFFRQFFENNLCGKVDLFLAGHDHSLQLLKPVNRCGDTHFVVSGAAAKTTSIVNASRNDAYWQTDAALGFFHILIKGNHLTINAYTVTEAGVVSLAHTETLTK